MELYVEVVLRDNLNSINHLVRQVKKLKDAHPELKLGFSNCVGGVLNAYREGDLSFEEAVALLSMKGEAPK